MTKALPWGGNIDLHHTQRNTEAQIASASSGPCPTNPVLQGHYSMLTPDTGWCIHSNIHHSYATSMCRTRPRPTPLGGGSWKGERTVRRKRKAAGLGRVALSLHHTQGLPALLY